MKEGAVPTKVAVRPTPINNDKYIESQSQELCEDTAESHEQADEVQVKPEDCTTVGDRIDEEANKMPCENASKDNMVDCTEEDSIDSNKDSISKEDTSDSNVIENEEAGKYFHRKCYGNQSDTCRNFSGMSRKKNL